MEEKYKDMATVDIVRAMAELRAQKDELEEKLKLINVEYDYIRLQRLPEKMEEEGIQGLKVDGVGRVSLRGDIYVSVLADNREVFHTWLRDTNRGDLIKDTVNASTLKASVKEWIKRGEEIPEELIKVTPFTMSVITKS